MTERDFDDVGMLLTGWCGIFVLLGQRQAGLLPHRRLASVAAGVTLLMLAHLMNSDRRVAARYHAVVRAGRRFLNRFVQARPDYQL